MFLQVLRWSALAFGVFYGFSHQRTIYASQKAQHDKHEWDQKQKLIDQAKAEYAKLKKPATPAGGDEGTSRERDYDPAARPAKGVGVQGRYKH